MLQNSRRSLGSCTCHIHRTVADKTGLDLLSLQRQSEDVRPTLGVSAVTNYTNIIVGINVIINIIMGN